jgi:ElaB/YqjD/DUF883 family membrane-anchored ribosome-binding protein
MTISTETSALKSDLNNAGAHVDQLLNKVSDESSAHLRGLRQKAADVVAAARDKLSSLDTDVRVQARQAVKVTDDYVHHNPWRAIGIGAVTGIVIGYLVSRK